MIRGMKPWVFADGTQLLLGGEVLGDSAFAADLRKQIEWRHTVDLMPPPGGSANLDPSIPCHIDSLARREARLGQNPLVSAPDGIVYPTRPKPAVPDPPGTVY